MPHGSRSSIQNTRFVPTFDPSTNTEVAIVVPPDVEWELISLTVALEQGAAQTPWPILRIRSLNDAVDATQTITLSAVPAAGDFKLTFTPPDNYQPAGATPINTPAIAGAGGVTAGEIQTALQDPSLFPYGMHAVTVGGAANGPFTVTFTEGAVGGRPIPLLAMADNTLEDAVAAPVTAAIAHGTEGVEGGVIYEGFGSSTVQAAATTCRYTWGVSLPLTGQIGATTNVHSTAPLPEALVLEPGTRIGTSTIGLGANTTYGLPTLYVIEYG